MRPAAQKIYKEKDIPAKHGQIKYSGKTSSFRSAISKPEEGELSMGGNPVHLEVNKNSPLCGKEPGKEGAGHLPDSKAI